MTNLAAIKVKANSNYTCQECDSTELIQAHHMIPGEDSSMIALCANCHALKHPNLSRNLFLSKDKQPYWHNKSAASLAREIGVSSRTIIRVARRFNIPRGNLSLRDQSLIKDRIAHASRIRRPKGTGLLLPLRAARYLGMTIQDFYTLVRLLKIPSLSRKRRRLDDEYYVELFSKDVLTWVRVFQASELRRVINMSPSEKQQTRWDAGATTASQKESKG